METSPTPSRPLRADAARNRRALLDAAFTAFHEGGVTASLDDIAKAAGVGAGTLYRHFPCRDDLVLAVIDDRLLALAERGEQMVDDADPVAAFTDWLDAFATQAGLFDGLARTLVNPEAGDDTTCKRNRRAGAALLDRAVAAGQLRADVSSADLLDVAMAIAWLGDQGRDAAQRSRLLALVLDGMRRVPSGSCPGSSPPA
ncbi:TetR/AcrR family transcriptional regulator [Mycobacterium sp. smrl_JER01]|uniref:TetR/AcrR family transcriptional regulator n=1 Tax=Mycobacterium sp. smrl_JER01 TaxID=3402633 RepID=UPI003AC674FD